MRRPGGRRRRLDRRSQGGKGRRERGRRTEVRWGSFVEERERKTASKKDRLLKRATKSFLSEVVMVEENEEASDFQIEEGSRRVELNRLLLLLLFSPARTSILRTLITSHLLRPQLLYHRSPLPLLLDPPVLLELLLQPGPPISPRRVSKELLVSFLSVVLLLPVFLLRPVKLRGDR